VGAVHVASSAPAAAGIVAKTIPARTSPGTRSHRLSAMSVIPLAEDHRVPEGDYHPSFGSPATTMLTRGFASPPCDGFALVERGLPVGIFCAGKMPEWIDSRQCVVTICDRGKCSSCDARESDTNECHSARQRTWGSATLLVAFDNPPSNLNLNFEKQADSARCALSPFAAERSALCHRVRARFTISMNTPRASGESRTSKALDGTVEGDAGSYAAAGQRRNVPRC
jgi:hypothetical protein